MKALAVRPGLDARDPDGGRRRGDQPDTVRGALGAAEARGEERVLADEELLYRPREPYEHVYVVLDGEILILDGEREDARVIAEHGRGKFLAVSATT
jgi:CRP-like cAMP-binding protein